MVEETVIHRVLATSIEIFVPIYHGSLDFVILYILADLHIECRDVWKRSHVGHLAPLMAATIFP